MFAGVPDRTTIVGVDRVSIELGGEEQATPDFDEPRVEACELAGVEGAQDLQLRRVGRRDLGDRREAL